VRRTTVTIEGKKVSFWSNQYQSATTVLLLHGFRGDHTGLLELARTFGQVSVIILDLPGYGDSEPFEGTHDFMAYAHFLDVFCGQLQMGPCIIAGHSFGASLGIVFAACFPARVQKLILITPVTQAATLEAGLGKAYYKLAVWLPPWLRTAYLRSRLVDILTDIILLKSPSASRRQHLILANQLQLKKLRTQVVIENFLSFYSTDILGMAAHIVAPTLLITGEMDHISPLASMQALFRQLRQGRMEVIPHGGHLVPLEQPHAVGRLVRTFINS
jgi:pimeloyl-ACP methyl ester carboxylesterase